MAWEFELDGVNYEDLESYIMTGIFGFCGCTGGEALVVIDKVLTHYDAAQYSGVYWEALVKDVFNGDEGSAYIVANLLDNTGLIEHGIAIRGAWLTDKGREVWVDIKKVIKKWAEEDKNE